jgi:hypothetical protein
MLGFSQRRVVLKTETLWHYSPSFVAPFRHPHSLRIISLVRISEPRVSLPCFACTRACPPRQDSVPLCTRVRLPSVTFGYLRLRVALGCPLLPSIHLISILGPSPVCGPALRLQPSTVLLHCSLV